MLGKPLNITMENYHLHECYEYVHADNSKCRVPADMRDPRLIGGCGRIHYPKLKWAESIENMVVTAGATMLLGVGFKSVTQITSWFIGLVGATHSYAIADTMASHAGWAESAAYSNGTRPAMTLGALSGTSTVTCDNSGSVAVFNINGTATLNGSFVTSNSTVSGTTGTLYGEGDYLASRGVASGDTVNVTITLTAAAA